ncbi:Fe-S cluster assembly protein SufD [Haliea sp. E1-2-M8]|uniref:Fe-S cluster assembly protein SufD n=1 Tax=Haliea sp. E1-2-M8 TaxID=3064706 RepID=UPI00271B011C|nr:Fe-S cluster assembly protein SufD [Haliea sp. E1-2-M8]MDO8861288.1 Fe-S cluster assembly protein SufD [Haliea sp. E1-2-M8]
MQRPLAQASSAAPAWLQDIQSRGRDAWKDTRLPTRKTEAWKYTSLQPLQQSFAVPGRDAAKADVSAINLPQLGGPTLVFTDGVYRAELSSTVLPSGLTLVRFADADAAQAEQIRTALGSALLPGRHVFAPLNEATLADGVFLQVAANAVVEQPVHIAWLTTGQHEAISITQRLLVCLGANSQATVVETYANKATGGTAFTNGITELLLDRGARLHHYRLQLEQGGAVHIGGVHARLGADSLLSGFHLALGSALKRIDLVVDHQGPGAHCDLDGIYLPRGTETVDYHTCIEHSVPNCTSKERFRGIIADEATAVFNGRIHIHPDAQKTRAELSNKNLLTSNKAEINTKPELEIYADDVQCAHGATVAQLDPLALHYLRTRGVPKEEAEVMLSYGFINELVEAVAEPGLQAFLKPLLANRFAPEPRLTRHIL